MASWRTVRTGCQFVNLDALRGTKVINDILQSVVPGQYNGKPQVIAHLVKCGLAVAINTTSCKLLEEKWGEEMSEWVGHTVKICRGQAPFGKSKVDAIIVSPVK